MKKIFIILAFLGLGASTLFGFYAFNLYIYNQKQGDGEPITPYAATLEGEYVCLPHRNTSGAITLECAFGLKTQTDEYYALDFGDNIPPTNSVTGQNVVLEGIVTPIESLSTNQWQKYDIEGIFSVEKTIN